MEACPPAHAAAAAMCSKSLSRSTGFAKCASNPATRERLRTLFGNRQQDPCVARLPDAVQLAVRDDLAAHPRILFRSGPAGIQQRLFGFIHQPPVSAGMVLQHRLPSAVPCRCLVVVGENDTTDCRSRSAGDASRTGGWCPVSRCGRNRRTAAYSQSALPSIAPALRVARTRQERRRSAARPRSLSTGSNQVYAWRRPT